MQTGADVGLNLSLASATRVAPPEPPAATVYVVEDDPSVAELARDLCARLGRSAVVYGAPGDFLRACEADQPAAVVLDWRLERELGSAAFMAIRHRFPQLPVVCWTGTRVDDLPVMVRDDPHTLVIGKDAGIEPFEAALRWAVDGNDNREIAGGRHLPHSA